MIGVNNMSLKQISKEYNDLPKTFRKIKNKIVFVHKHGNLDLVKQGMNLITRATVSEQTKSVIKIQTSKKLPLGHCFLGVVGSKETANCYVHESTDTYAIIGSMGSDSL